ncbi:MAG: AAA family ATPase, partial [Paludibacteraceae bacterium]|nr:AAA family ATPase [Paludibacteraceae bacterium]
MQALIEQFKSKLELTPTKFLREHHNQINWDCRIIGILGQKGVGKSTLILQHIKLHDNISEVLYVQADDIYFGAHTILELAKNFYSHGGRILYVDEIHKYNNWSHEIKLIYDQVPLLKVVYSGSSILDLEQGGADLSRRVVQYHLPVWSLREFLNIRNGWSLRVSTLQEVLSGKVDFPYGDERPLKYFEEYLHKGCYP